jgi:hypothetical protein
MIDWHSHRARERVLQLQFCYTRLQPQRKAAGTRCCRLCACSTIADTQASVLYTDTATICCMLQVQALRMDGVKAAAMSSDQDYQVTLLRLHQHKRC